MKVIFLVLFAVMTLASNGAFAKGEVSDMRCYFSPGPQINDVSTLIGDTKYEVNEYGTVITTPAYLNYNGLEVVVRAAGPKSVSVEFEDISSGAKFQSGAVDVIERKHQAINIVPVAKIESSGTRFFVICKRIKSTPKSKK
jgi:hypothetical protein